MPEEKEVAIPASALETESASDFEKLIDRDFVPTTEDAKSAIEEAVGRGRDEQRESGEEKEMSSNYHGCDLLVCALEEENSVCRRHGGLCTVDVDVPRAPCRKK